MGTAKDKHDTSACPQRFFCHLSSLIFGFFYQCAFQPLWSGKKTENITDIRSLTIGFLLLQYSVLFTVTVDPYICFDSFLFLDLYVLGDDALIGKGSFMQSKHICVLIHS